MTTKNIPGAPDMPVDLPDMPVDLPDMPIDLPDMPVDPKPEPPVLPRQLTSTERALFNTLQVRDVRVSDLSKEEVKFIKDLAMNGYWFGYFFNPEDWEEPFVGIGGKAQPGVGTRELFHLLSLPSDSLEDSTQLITVLHNWTRVNAAALDTALYLVKLSSELQKRRCDRLKAIMTVLSLAQAVHKERRGI